MKVAKACRQCREGKRRCRLLPQGDILTCLPCQQRKLECSKSLAPPTKRVLAAKQDGQSQLNLDKILLSFDESAELVDLYFRYVHDRPHSLFHEKTFYQDLFAGEVEPCLQYAMYAIGCHFTDRVLRPGMANALMNKAGVLFAQHLEKISLDMVQAAILLANGYAARQNHELEALYFGSIDRHASPSLGVVLIHGSGIANRMAYVLRLHETDPFDSPIDREIKCRVWWSLYMAERWCPPGLGLPRQLTKSDKMLDYPMDESVFQSMSTTSQMSNVPAYTDGFWKYNVTLVEVLGPIQDLNMTLLDADCDHWLLDRDVEVLWDRLVSWQKALPAHAVMNAANLAIHQGTGQGGTFVALHLGYHHYATLLFYHYLETEHQTTPAAHEFAEMCRQHALSFSQLLHHARQQDGCHVVYLTVAYMTMVSSSVLLHMLLIGDNTTIETAKVHLTYNFEALIELRKYWPSVENVIRRLLIFQTSCLRGQDHAHQVDRWMVRFLLEHALPLEEKHAWEGSRVDEPKAPMSKIDISPARTHMLDEIFSSWYDSTRAAPSCS